MVVSFTLPGTVFSINKASARDIRFKTTAYKDYAQKTLYQLNEIKELYDMALLHQEQGGTFCVSLIAYYPHHIFYTKDGHVSAKTIDCSNFEKIILDLIFGMTMNINDKYVTELNSKKTVGASYSLSVKIELLN